MASRRSARENGRGVRILGVDPGTVVAGWAVIDAVGGATRHVASGQIRLAGARAGRLAHLHDRLAELVRRFRPAVLSLEKSFVGDNVQTAFRLGEARGAAMVAAASAGLDVVEYAPAEVKIAVTGSGRATKWQIQRMVARLLDTGDHISADQADALAVALCHAHTFRPEENPPRPPSLHGARAGRRAAGRRAWERLCQARQAAQGRAG